MSFVGNRIVEARSASDVPPERLNEDVGLCREHVPRPETSGFAEGLVCEAVADEVRRYLGFGCVGGGYSLLRCVVDVVWTTAEVVVAALAVPVSAAATCWGGEHEGD